MPIPHLVLFNGPPDSGKDTAAQALAEDHSFGYMAWDRISMPMKKAFAGMMALNIDARGNVEVWESKKGEIIPLFGISYRQWQIDFSEKFMKPLYGEDIFAKLFLERFTRRTGTYHGRILGLVPDCGFPIEVQAIAKTGWPILLFRLFRDGTSFEGDSRHYLPAEGWPSNVVVADVFNGHLLDFQKAIKDLTFSWLQAY